MTRTTTAIRVGVGGWTFEPWRDNFFPKGLAQKRELEYATRQLTAIEVNATYYSTMKPASFKKWHDETPDNFMFSLKANRFATNRRVLGEAGDSISRFVDSGLGELGKKLGPIVWQFAPTKQFKAEDFEAFLSLLPKDTDGHKLRHVMDVRHDSFKSTDYLKLARKYKCATVFTDSPKFPSFADLTGDFAYVRLMNSEEEEKTGYPPKALDRWAIAAQAWAKGGEPDDLPRVKAKGKAGKARDVFVYFINGAKERAPAAAQALLSQLGFKPHEGTAPKLV
ncbi:MAG: DUF72 domain-containing protein [Rhodoferax sp.]|nr:DUF72 domain-containing protein [Rhodoferax sp.]